MGRLFLAFVFLIPFQARIYKHLKTLSLSWIDPAWQLPGYFEPFADFFISDFLILALFGGALFYKKTGILNKYLIAFLAVAFISIVLSGYGSYPIHYWRWVHLVLAAFVIYAACSWPISLKTIATVVVLSAMLECAVTIPQYLSQHHLGLKMMGEPTIVSKHMVASHFAMPESGVTSIDYMLLKGKGPANVIRAHGTLPHPNILGAFLVFSLLMTSYLYEMVNKKGWVGAAIVLQLITLFMTYSRAALFGFGGAALLWLFLHYLKEKRISTLWKPWLMGAGSSILLFFPQLFHRGGVITYNTVAMHSDLMRVSMSDIAFAIIRDHPWFGVGFNNYLIAFAKYAAGSAVESIWVHNIYLLIAAETGLIGLGLFLMFCLSVIYRGWKNRDSLECRTLLALFLAFLAIGFVDYHPIVFQQMRLIFFLTAGLLLFNGAVITHLSSRVSLTAIRR
ncbi:MAG: O-antigen ligase family protein [Rhabdochlamydiaceae bacterium]|nr:O-antigen ligase family protein [Rhabdochlamydiaceae bacterium]